MKKGAKPPSISLFGHVAHGWKFSSHELPARENLEIKLNIVDKNQESESKSLLTDNVGVPMSRWVCFEFLTPVVLVADLSSQLFLHFYEDLRLLFSNNFLLLSLLFHIDLRLL